MLNENWPGARRSRRGKPASAKTEKKEEKWISKRNKQVAKKLAKDKTPAAKVNRCKDCGGSFTGSLADHRCVRPLTGRRADWNRRDENFRRTGRFS